MVIDAAIYRELVKKLYLYYISTLKMIKTYMYTKCVKKSIQSIMLQIEIHIFMAVCKKNIQILPLMVN